LARPKAAWNLALERSIAIGDRAAALAALAEAEAELARVGSSVSAELGWEVDALIRELAGGG
jgi:hypothetical protein